LNGSISGGHFLGFYAAIFGLAALVVWLGHDKTRARLGKKRWQVGIVGFILLFALAIFGSGSRRITFGMAIGPAYGVHPRTTEAHVAAALARATSPEVLAYLGTLTEPGGLARPGRIGKALSAKRVSGLDLREEGFHVTPPPGIGESWLIVSYDDEENAVLAALDRGEGVTRMQVAEGIARDVLPSLCALELLRASSTDEEKITILRGHTMRVPRAAELFLRELDALSRGASPALAEAITVKRAFVQKYVEDPTLRGLDPGRKPSLSGE